MKSLAILVAAGTAILAGSLPARTAPPAPALRSEPLALRDGFAESGTDGGRYDVPLLQIPAFINATSATGAGARALLLPINDMHFSSSMGAQYWPQGETGWSWAVHGAAASDWRTQPRSGAGLGDGISFATLPMRDGAALPAITPLTVNGVPVVGKTASFSEGGHSPGMLDPVIQMQWLGDSALGMPGGLTGGVFLILALAALLFSQLSGSQKSGRRRRSSPRRRQ